MRLAGVLLLCACILLSGCRVDATREKHLMSSRPGEAADTRRAHYDGEHRLYKLTASSSSAPEERLASRRLMRGEAIGFRGGRLAGRVAVVGNDEIGLDGASRYAWRVQPDAGQIDREKTAMVIVGVAIAGAIVSGVIIALTPF